MTDNLGYLDIFGYSVSWSSCGRNTLLQVKINFRSPYDVDDMYHVFPGGNVGIDNYHVDWDSFGRNHCPNKSCHSLSVDWLRQCVRREQ